MKSCIRECNEVDICFNHDCMRLPKLCKKHFSKSFQLEINHTSIVDMISSLNTMRQQAAQGILQFVTKKKSKSGENKVVHHTLKKAKYMNEIVSNF